MAGLNFSYPPLQLSIDAICPQFCEPAAFAKHINSEFSKFLAVYNAGRTNVKTHVMLVNPPYPVGAPQSRFLPLGLAYLAAVLEEKGNEVTVIDCQAAGFDVRRFERELERARPEIVGVTASTLTYKPAIEIVKTAKASCPECLTVMGGPHVTVMDQQTLEEQPSVDVIVRREGEQTLLELAEKKHEGKLQRFNEIAGITFRIGKQIVRTSDRPFIQNLDVLPHPAYGRFPLSEYKVAGKMYLPIITSRGCPFQCTFCLASKMCGKRFRARSPRTVVDELEWLRDEYGADAFAFYDDTFTFDEKRAYDICEEIIRRRVGIPWDCRTRVDRVNRKILVKMREANCRLIHYGIESGSQKMLDSMKKGTTTEQNAKAIKLTKDVGIAVAISVVVGYPGETVELLRETVEFIKKTEPDYIYACEAIPYPGTELYDLLKDLGWRIDPDWNHYDEQTRVFENPSLPRDRLDEIRGELYDWFFSPTYLLRKSLDGDFYSQIMARAALNHLLWRIKLPRKLFSAAKLVLPKR